MIQLSMRLILSYILSSTQQPSNIAFFISELCTFQGLILTQQNLDEVEVVWLEDPGI